LRDLGIQELINLKGRIHSIPKFLNGISIEHGISVILIGNHR
jgi:hypothetical protein